MPNSGSTFATSSVLCDSEGDECNQRSEVSAQRTFPPTRAFSTFSASHLKREDVTKSVARGKARKSLPSSINLVVVFVDAVREEYFKGEVMAAQGLSTSLAHSTFTRETENEGCDETGRLK